MLCRWFLALALGMASSAQAFTLNDVGRCLLKNVGPEAKQRAIGRLNIQVLSYNQILMEIQYWQVDEQFPMPYHVSLEGGYDGRQEEMEGVAILYQMAPMTNAEMAVLRKEAKYSKDFMDLFFPEGFTQHLDTPAGREEIMTLTSMFPHLFKTSTRSLKRLMGVWAYDLQEQANAEEFKSRMEEFRANSGKTPMDTKGFKFTIHPKEGEGKAFNVTKCLLAPPAPTL